MAALIVPATTLYLLMSGKKDVDARDERGYDGDGSIRSHRNMLYRLNTNNIEAVDVFLSSGASGMMFGGWRDPTSTAMYCLPFTA